MKLSELKKDQKVIVKRVISSEFSSKLIELGIVEGQVIRFLHSAPFGGPKAFQVGTYILALRNSEAAVVEVEMVEHE